MISKNTVKNPTSIEDYVKAIKNIWDDQGTLGKTPKGQKMREFIICAASTWPLNFFIKDWDSKGFLYPTDNTKAWWAIQKLTGLHCHPRKTFDDANHRATTKQEPQSDSDDAMDITLTITLTNHKLLKTRSPSTKKRKSQDENKMGTDNDKAMPADTKDSILYTVPAKTDTSPLPANIRPTINALTVRVGVEVGVGPPVRLPHRCQTLQRKLQQYQHQQRQRQKIQLKRKGPSTGTGTGTSNSTSNRTGIGISLDKSEPQTSQTST
jgi:hypothetical protein